MPRHRRRQHNRAAQAKESSKRRISSDQHSSQPQFSPLLDSLITFLPNVLILCIAIAAAYYELLTHGNYANSPSLLSFLKHTYIFYVCMTCRSKLWPLVGPSLSKKTRQKSRLPKLIWAEMKLFLCVIAVSCAGTSVIQPIFNEWPYYRAISAKCVPLFIVSELVFGYLKVPKDLVLTGIGLTLAWYKSITTKSLALAWGEAKDANSIHFVLVMTANLFASAFLIQVIACTLTDSSKRPVALRSALSSMLTSVCTATLAGVIAYIASQQRFLAQFGLQALFLDLLLAFILLNKYSKSRIEQVLFSQVTKYKQN